MPGQDFTSASSASFVVKRFVVTLLCWLTMLSPDARAQTFTITGNMEYARSGHQATLLLEGRVLVTGGAGISGEAIARSEVFDPATGAWSLSGNNITARVDHAAALLQAGVRPIKTMNCRDENDILAFGMGFHLAITLQPKAMAVR
jgi:hypothetical protein